MLHRHAFAWLGGVPERVVIDNCKYHAVFVPKRRRKELYGGLRRQLGPIIHELARQKQCQILAGH